MTIKNIFLSIVLGYIFWFIFSQSFDTVVWINAPLSFYGNIENIKINAPELIKLQLKAKRKFLYMINLKNLAVHINTDTLQNGMNYIKITSRNIFLPKEIKLVNYCPSNITVEIQKSYN